MYVNLVVYYLVCYLARFYAEFFYMSISVRVSSLFFLGSPNHQPCYIFSIW